MFSFFKKEKKPTYDEWVWLKKSVKYKAAYKMTQTTQHQQEVLFTIAQFPHTLEEFSFLLKQGEHPFEVIDEVGNITAIHQGATYLILADKLEKTGNAEKLQQLLQNTTVHFLILEHYPLPQKEVLLLEQLQIIKAQAIPAFYTSLDEPFMKAFDSGRIISLMQSMGLDEEEHLSHKMITKSIQRAQKKISEKVLTDGKAHSAEEWYEKYVK